MQTEQLTYFNVSITSADSKVDEKQYVSEKQLKDIQSEAAKVGSAVDITKAQTFAVSSASSLEEITQVVPNPDVALSYFNYGLTLAQHNVKRDLMKDSEWAAVEGVYDLLADVQLPKEKRVADPLSGARRNLKALWATAHPGEDPPTDEQINEILRQFTGAAQAA